MSKKGFKKLEDHEMTTFGGGDSGSETELYLSPTTSSVKRGWYSWCLFLYMVLLTLLILVLCVFMAFMAYTMKAIADNCSNIETRLDVVKDDLFSLRGSNSHSEKGVVAELRSLNRSLLKIENTFELTHQEMELSMAALVNRVVVLETGGKQDGTFSSGMEQLHKEIGTLNSTVRQLVGPSGDVQVIMKAMDSITTSIDSYDSQLRELRRDHGDISANQATLVTAVEAVKSSYSDLKAEVTAMRDASLERNKVLHQSIELLSMQLVQLEMVVGALNQSLGHKQETTSVVLEKPLPSTTDPHTATWQPTMKPDHSSIIPSPSPPTSSSSYPSPTSSPATLPSSSPSLHLHPSQHVTAPPQSTPSAAQSGANVSVVPSVSSSAQATPPQTTVPSAIQKHPQSDTNVSVAENGTETGDHENGTETRNGVPSAIATPLPSARATRLSDLKKAFDSADTDNNGELTIDEVLSAYGTEGKEVFTKLDKDGDSIVTLDEMESVVDDNHLP